MQKRVNTRKLGREKSQRVALLRSLAISLIKHGKIKTTKAKAKELRPFIEKLVTKAREGSLASTRVVASRLGETLDKSIVSKITTDIAPRYKDRNGGYTRITKLPARAGDASEMAIIEFV